MLIEARVVLPGAQALLGFQLIVMMTPEFDKLLPPVRLAHLVALGSVLVSVILLIAPAAVHRTAFAGRDTPEAYRAGSILVTAALLPLAIGICCDFYVAISRLFGAGLQPQLFGAGAFIVLLVLWYGVPLLLRSTQHSTKS
jgi:hypothetical protein